MSNSHLVTEAVRVRARAHRCAIMRAGAKPEVGGKINVFAARARKSDFTTSETIIAQALRVEPLTLNIDACAYVT